MTRLTILVLSCLVAAPAFADDTTDAKVQRELRSHDKSGFEQTWRQRRGRAHLDVGNYEVLVGDAEKPMDDCMRAFENSSMPPSCLAGLTLQRKPPAASSK
jgi:hypothetical protein